MKLGLLECDHVSERFRHLSGDYADMFAALLAGAAPEMTVVRFDVCRDDRPAAVDDCDAYLCTGSRRSVYDPDGWIGELASFVRQAHDAGVPFVGICFGHQMLAEALGGKVERAAGGWGVGVHEIGIARPEPWMAPAAHRCRLQFMHQDQVVRLPPGGRVLGRTDHCPVAMLAVGDTMLGLQAHPEFTVPYADALLAERAELIGVERASAARRSLATPTDEDLVAGWIVHALHPTTEEAR